MKVAFIYNDIFRNSNFGEKHPVTINRVSNVYDLSKIINFQNVYYHYSKLATEKELLIFHEKEYIDILKKTELSQRITIEDSKKYNLGTSSNPIFKEMFRRHSASTGSLFLATNLIVKKEFNYIFSPGSGAHHGKRNKASGFCYLNDIATCIMYLKKKGMKKIAYFDMDAHYGDGVVESFRNDKNVFTISIHQKDLWPKNGNYVFDEGIINYPVEKGFSDNDFKNLLENRLFNSLKYFKPELIILQMGADCLHDDYMSKLSLSNNAMSFVINKFKNITNNLIITGGGGYNPWSTLRAWIYNLATLSNEKEKLILNDDAKSFLASIKWKRVPENHWISEIIDQPNIFQED